MNKSQLQEAGYRWRKLTADPEPGFDLQADLQARRQAAYEEGLAQGVSAGNEQVQLEIQALQAAISELAASQERLQQAAAQEAISMAQTAFEAVFQHLARENDAIFDALSRQLLAGVANHGAIHVGGALFAAIGSEDVVQDDSLPPWALGVDVNCVFQQLDIQANVASVLSCLSSVCEVQGNQAEMSMDDRADIENSQ